jgi:hypothetical protein
VSGTAVATEALADGFDVLALDSEYIGSCPCATVVVDGARLELHCWRVCSACEYVGIHYEGAAGRAAAERIKPLLDEMNWYGEWELREGFRHPRGDAQ